MRETLNMTGFIKRASFNGFRFFPSASLSFILIRY